MDKNNETNHVIWFWLTGVSCLWQQWKQDKPKFVPNRFSCSSELPGCNTVVRCYLFPGDAFSITGMHLIDCCCFFRCKYALKFVGVWGSLLELPQTAGCVERTRASIGVQIRKSFGTFGLTNKTGAALCLWQQHGRLFANQRFCVKGFKLRHQKTP